MPKKNKVTKSFEKEKSQEEIKQNDDKIKVSEAKKISRDKSNNIKQKLEENNPSIVDKSISSNTNSIPKNLKTLPIVNNEKGWKALTALQTKVQDMKQNSNKLIQDKEIFYVIFKLNKPTAKRLKPYTIKLPNTQYGLSDRSVCQISKDPEEEYETLIQDSDLPIKQVIGLQRFRTEYKPYQYRRELVSQHDLFLVDRSILSRVCGNIGVIFQRANKYV